MDSLKLILPAPEHETAAMDFAAEFRACGEPRIHGSAGLHNETDYSAWLKKLELWKNPALLPVGRTVSSTFFAMHEGQIVGIIDVRHELNDELLLHGGHIGYSVRPSKRGKGIATRMLSLALDFCRKLGIERALLTCDKSNPASARVMIKNGAVLENEIVQDSELLQRYWIAL